MKSKHDVYDRKIIDGKPHFGIYIGKSIIINSYNNKEKIISKYRETLSTFFKEYEKDGIKVLNETYIFRDYNDFHLNATYGCKYMLWGRAYKVMKYAKKGNETKHYKKCWVNGRRVLRLK